LSALNLPFWTFSEETSAEKSLVRANAAADPCFIQGALLIFVDELLSPTWRWQPQKLASFPVVEMRYGPTLNNFWNSPTQINKVRYCFYIIITGLSPVHHRGDR
jgi:hypothetical protein